MATDTVESIEPLLEQQKYVKGHYYNTYKDFAHNDFTYNNNKFKITSKRVNWLLIWFIIDFTHNRIYITCKYNS